MQSSTVLATIQASIRASSIMIYNIMVSILDSSLATLGRVTKQNACNMPSFKPRLVLVCVVENEICYMLDLRRSDRMDKYYSDAGSWADDGPPCDPDDDDGFVGGGDAGLAGGF